MAAGKEPYTFIRGHIVVGFVWLGDKLTFL